MRALLRRAAAAGATLALWAAVTAAAPAVSAPGYPTWADVQAARHSVSATHAEVAKLQDALQEAQKQAAQTSAEAIRAQQTAERAQSALDAAQRHLDTLTAETASARKTAASDTAAAGRLTATLYQVRGTEGTLTLELLAAPDKTGLLDQLSTLQHVTNQWTLTTQQARQARSTLASLQGDARQAQQTWQRLDDQAREAAQRAQQAAKSADAVASAAQKHTNTVYAQLASLKKTSAATQRRYEIGVQVAAQAAAERRARQAAAARAARLAQEQAGQGASSAGLTSVSAGPGSVSPAAAQAYASHAIGSYGWGSDQFSCLVTLWTMESGWQWDAINASSGAYGIPQALPAEKLAAAGPDWRTSAATQIDWGLAYISNQYGTPCAALAHETSHEPHWY